MSAFTGTWTLTWLALRRDRVQLGAWILGLSVLAATIAANFTSLFADEQDVRAAVRVLAANPVMRAFGLPVGPDIGAFLMLRTFVTLSVLVGLMNVLAVVRHTRQNEETGRAEMIGSTAVGRYASLTAALLVAVVANAVLAALVGLGFVVNGLPASGSFAAGAALGAVGLAFTGIAAIAAQLSETGRGANGFGAIGIGAAFLLASAGSVLGRLDATGFAIEAAWPAWLSPIGWGQQVQPFSDERWALLALPVAFFAVTSAVALHLSTRRDVGQGLLPQRPGPAEAPRSLLSPFGLAWRLQRGVFIGWALGMAAFGAVFGAVSSEFESLLEDVGAAAEIFERIGGAAALTDTFFVAVLGLMSTVIAAFTIQSVLRLRGEEADGPLETLLSTAVSRTRWLLSHVTVAVLGTLALLLVTGVATGLAAGIATGDLAGQFGRVTLTALVQAPAVLVLGGLVLLVFAVAPRVTGTVAWLAFAVALVLGPMIGALLDLPAAVQDLSPFSHVPAYPAEPLEVAPLVAMLAVAVALGAAGVALFRRRDLAMAADGSAPSVRDRVAARALRREPPAAPAPEA